MKTMDTSQISPEEMIEELLNANANLTMQLAAANILIRKLQGQNGETNGQVEQRLVNAEPG